MIEFVVDVGDQLVLINPCEIVYVRNDDGNAIIKLSTNEQFVVADYNEVLARLSEAGIATYLDKEGREALEEAVEVEKE